MTPDFKSILVPVDFSSNSARALEYAHTLAIRFDASLHLIHVCEVPSAATGSMDAFAIAYTDWSQRLGAEAEGELLKLVPKLPDVTVTTEVLFGNPPRAIVAAAASRNSDLIVMGTHGHGALMHALLGNVAERVVRTAPCPVLTIREPREAEPVAGRAVTNAGVLVAGMLTATMLSFAAVVTAAAQEPAAPPPAEMRQQVTGGEVYRTYCATCHGPAGRGDGPLASSMRRKPADLTEIAKRNGGEYPSEIVFRTIDGKTPVRGHGGPDMPVWGDAFARSRDGGDPATVKARIDSLVDYIRTLQVKAVH